jgi:hypothetical protein
MWRVRFLIASVFLRADQREAGSFNVPHDCRFRQVLTPGAGCTSRPFVRRGSWGGRDVYEGGSENGVTSSQAESLGGRRAKISV